MGEELVVYCVRDAVGKIGLPKTRNKVKPLRDEISIPDFVEHLQGYRVANVSEVLRLFKVLEVVKEIKEFLFVKVVVFYQD